MSVSMLQHANPRSLCPSLQIQVNAGKGDLMTTTPVHHIARSVVFQSHLTSIRVFILSLSPTFEQTSSASTVSHRPSAPTDSLFSSRAEILSPLLKVAEDANELCIIPCL